MSKGVIYILTNPSFPQFVKIGYAKSLEKRLGQLNRSETLPYAFRAYAVYETDGSLTDKAVHELIDRLNPDLRTIETFNGRTRTKEFFEMPAEDAYSILDAVARISGTVDRLHRVTPTGAEVREEQEAEQVRRGRRAPFRFSMVGLAPGDEVAFAKDRSVVATVVDDNHVEFEGVTSSLSALAERLLGSGPVQGPLFFTFGNETLVEMRERIEREQALH